MCLPFRAARGLPQIARPQPPLPQVRKHAVVGLRARQKEKNKKNCVFPKKLYLCTSIRAKNKAQERGMPTKSGVPLCFLVNRKQAKAFMSEQQNVDKINELVEKYVSQEGKEHLFWVETKLHGKELHVYMDSDKGLTLEECAELSRHLEAVLDVELWLGDDYTLEVSSHGVGNPLKNTRQYRKNIGREVSVELNGTHKNAKGILEAADDEGIEISYSERVTIEGTKKKQTLHLRQRLLFADIKKTIVKISFK